MKAVKVAKSFKPSSLRSSKSFYYFISTNFHDANLFFFFFLGILQKGDGHITYMNYEYPRILYGDMGVGLQRQLDCLDCEGKAYESKLLMPVALASDSDGNIYVGDFNMVRKIGTDGIVYTLLKFR